MTGEIGFRPITATHVNSYNETVTLVIRDAATGELQTITSNRLHPYFVSLVAPQVHLVANGPTLRGTLTTGRFVEAQHIESGAWLVTETGLEAEVVAKTIARSPLTAYNLTVAEFETFFVAGADNDNAPGVWVHNCPAPKPNLSDLADRILKWLGPESRIEPSKKGAFQMISKDNSRLIRFDVTPQTSHGLPPHINVEPGRHHKFLKR